MESRWKLGLVTFFLFLLLPVSLQAASLSVSPASGVFEVGERVTVKVNVSSGAPINAISGTISFPTSIFVVESVSKSASVLNFWVSEPNFSSGAGILQFEGVTLGGFQGGTGTVVSVVLRAIKEGNGEISFRSGQILANDGQGTDVTSGLNGAIFSVEPRKQVEKPKEVEEKIIEESPQEPPSIKSPEIMLLRKFGEKIIAGRSDYAGFNVLLTFVSENGEKVIVMDSTDINGKFEIFVPQTLKRGKYKVTAILVKDNISSITHSFTSNEIVISIGNIFSDIGLTVMLCIIFLLIALVYLIVRTHIHLKKNQKLRFFVKKESKEAIEAVHKSFKILKEELNSANEKVDSKIIKEDLNQAEKLITKEIKDIENQ